MNDKEIQQKINLLGLKITPQQYKNETIVLALLFSLLSGFLVFLHGHFLIKVDLIQIILLTLIFIILSTVIWYAVLIRRLDFQISKLRLAIEYDLGFLLKHLAVLLRGGVPIFNSLVLVSDSYGETGKVFKKVIEKASAGMSLTDALREEANSTVSLYMRMVLLQISNAIDSGSDLVKMIEELEKQITTEKMNLFTRYTNSINPLMAIYMVIGVILPSLSIAFLLILLSFTGKAADLDIAHLLILAIITSFIQLFFTNYVLYAKPRYSLFE
jgi:archaellum biogenesis protein FlaJ (TadC family)